MANFTKKALADAMRKRLVKTKLENITIKELTEDCGLNRQTFYYHFKDIYDLMEWIFKEEAEKLMKDAEESPDLKSILLNLAQYVMDNESTILHAYKSIDRSLVDSFLRRWVRPVVTKLVDQKAEGRILDEDDRHFIIEISITVVIGLCFEALENDMFERIERQADRLVILLDGTLEDTVLRFAK